MRVKNFIKSLVLATLASIMMLGYAYAGDEAKEKPEKHEPEVKAQTTCPVMGGKINKSLFVEKDGKRIYVCCKGCLTKVEKNFDEYASKYEKAGVNLSPAHTQEKCPVMGGKIHKDKYVEQNGKRIYVCCDACISKVAADFEKYEKKLEEKNVTLEKVESK